MSSFFYKKNEQFLQIDQSNNLQILQFKLIFVLEVYGGLRVKEIHDLTWNDFNFQCHNYVEVIVQNEKIKVIFYYTHIPFVFIIL